MTWFIGQVAQCGPRSSQERRSVSLSRMNAPFLVPSRTRTFFTMVAPRTVRTAAAMTSTCHDHHPRHAEAVRDHPEARGEEGRAQGHVYVPALSQGGEHPIGLILTRHGEGQ